MKDKEKQIEEMAIVISGSTEVDTMTYYKALNKAKKCYKIVIPEDSVVLSTQEYLNTVTNIREEFEYMYKDKVVLSKEEYEKLIQENEKLKQHKLELQGAQQDLIKRIAELERELGCYIEDQKILLQRTNTPDPFWFCSFGGCEGVCKECKDTCEKSIFVKERKETIKKLKGFILSKMNNATDDLTWLMFRQLYWQVDEFAKQLGIGIKE